LFFCYQQQHTIQHRSAQKGGQFSKRIKDRKMLALIFKNLSDLPYKCATQRCRHEKQLPVTQNTQPQQPVIKKQY